MEDVDWIHLAQVKDKWWACVNTVTDIQVQKMLVVTRPNYASQVLVTDVRTHSASTVNTCVHLDPICERDNCHFMLPDLVLQNISV
jgi:hypothetical protein